MWNFPALFSTQSQTPEREAQRPGARGRGRAGRARDDVVSLLFLSHTPRPGAGTVLVRRFKRVQ